MTTGPALSAPREHPTRPELQGSFGMVASTHWIASSVGMSVLERGGNAFDAATAAGFVLQVVEPHLNGPGGDSSTVLWSSAEDRSYVVCGQGPAPAAATLAHYSSLGLAQVPGTGLLAATVPGAFGAWLTILARWGTWELADVLQYALHYADSGFPVLMSAAATIAAVQEQFTEHWPTSAQVWLDDGAAPTPGSWWRLPGVAQTYRRVLQESTGATREARIEAAREAWYSGFVAEEIGRFSTSAWHDTSGRRHRGVLTAEDLNGWAPPVESPTAVEFAGRYQVLKTGAWGQGPVLGQQLRLLEALGLDELPLRSADWIHTVVEAAKLAYADREAYYGDPLDQPVPVEQLLSRRYATQRAGLVAADASRELRPGTVAGYRPRLARLDPSHGLSPGGSTSGTGEPTVGSHGDVRGDTCHVDVVDRWGNMVSATPSGGWLQSSPVIPTLGFPLGTRAQMFFLEPDLPNSLRPGARPRTTLSPSLVLRDGAPWMACGTPGGDQQDQWQVPFLLDVFAADAGGHLDLQAAIDAPAFHSTHFPSSFAPRDAHPGQVVVESRLSADVIGALQACGHQILTSGPWSLGRLSAVVKDGSRLRAAANPRGAQGYAVGR